MSDLSGRPGRQSFTKSLPKNLGFRGFPVCGGVVCRYNDRDKGDSDMITTTAPVTHNSNTHQCRDNDRTAGSAYRRQLLATVLYLASLTGHSDGETYAVCVGCGENAYVGGAPRNMDTLNLGHCEADATGGTYCAANMLPLCRQCNEDMGKDALTDVLVPLYDNRHMWDGKLIKDSGKVKQEAQANRGRANWTRPTAI